MAPPETSLVDPLQIWQQVCAKIPPRGFLRTLVDSLTVLGAEGRNFLLAYAIEDKSAIETLATTSNRRQLESLLSELSGSDWTLKLTAKERCTLERPDQQAPTKAAPFPDDPLIQEALEMFKGQIKS